MCFCISIYASHKFVDARKDQNWLICAWEEHADQKAIKEEGEF